MNPEATMKKTLVLCLSVLLVLFAACAEGGKGSGTKTAGQEDTMDITLTIGTQTFTATLAGNEAAQAFAARFPLTLDMSELNGNEYYGYLAGALPTASTNPRKISAGDIKLYGSDCVVIFYKSFATSYRYTTLGTVSDSSALQAALTASGGIVTFALAQEER